MTRRARSVAFVAFVAFAFPALAGCLDLGGAITDDAVGGPGFDVRGADFYHSYYANNESWTDELAWENPAREAGLEARHELRHGSVKVTLKDANGATVFTQEWWPGTRGGEFHPGQGEPGEWTIVIDRRDATGQFDVHVWSQGEPPEDADA